MLAGTLATALGLVGPSPVLAACTQVGAAVASNSTVDCSGTETNPVGDGTQSQVTVNILPGATLNVGNATAVDILDNRVVNAGSIIAGDASAGRSTGIQVQDNSVIINNGSIRIGNADVGQATGIQLLGINNTVTNNGQIIVGDGQNGGSTAVGIATGDGPNQITNNNSITVGVLGSGILILNNAGNVSTIVNAAGATISVGNGSWGIASQDGNIITNAGSIVAGNSDDSASRSAIGIFVGKDHQVTNSGSIRVGDGDGGTLAFGISTTSSGNTITNSGTIIAGTTATGVNTTGGTNTFTNTSTGLVSVGDGSTAVSMGGTGNLANNYGMIVAGAGGTGFSFQGDGTLNNYGTIRATTDGFSIFACTCTTTIITNYGLLDGKITIEGDSTFTNNGLIAVTDPISKTPIQTVYLLIGSGGTVVNFEQTATGTLSFRITSPSGGNAPIDGMIADNYTNLAGTMRIAVQPGLYANSVTSDIAISRTSTLSGPITSTFDQFTSSSPFFTVTPIYTGSGGAPNNYDFLQVQLDRVAFNAVPGLTPNQKAVATALEAGYQAGPTGDGVKLLGNVLAATSIGVLDQISGEGAAAAQNAAFGIGSQFNNSMQNQGLFGPSLGGLSIVIPPAQYAPSRAARGHEAFASLKTEPEAAQPGRWRVWSAGFGSTRAVTGEASPGSSSQSIQGFGGSLGVDRQLTADLLLGFAVGASESMFAVHDLSTSGRITGGHVGLYAVKTWGAYYAAASLSYARFDNSTTRTIASAGPTETASGRFGSDQLGGRIELGWKQALTGYTLTPFVAIEPAVLWQHGYSESSVDATGAPGVFGLAVASRTATSLPTFVGMQADTRLITAQGAAFAPYARASWVHEFEPDRRISASFISLPLAAFTVAGARPAADSARLDAGAKLIFPGGPALFASFTGEWSGRTESYAATGGFRTAW